MDYKTIYMTPLEKRTTDRIHTYQDFLDIVGNEKDVDREVLLSRA